MPDWEECVVVSPDEGGTKRSVSVANDLQLDFALIHNRFGFIESTAWARTVTADLISLIRNKAREGRRTKKYSAATEDGSTSSTSLTFREDAESSKVILSNMARLTTDQEQGSRSAVPTVVLGCKNMPSKPPPQLGYRGA